MIKIERHVNFDNWINVSIYNKLVDQFTSRIHAVRYAQKLAWDGLARWDHYNAQCSSVGGEVTHLLDARNERVLHQDLDL